MGNQLCQKRIVEGRDEVTGIAMGIQPDAGALWPLPVTDASGAGTKSMMRRLGVDAAFDGMAEKAYIGLLERQWFAAGNPQLLRHEVYSRDHFGHGMFHLNPGVHLQKKELVGVVIKDELHRTGILIADASRQRSRGVANLIANLCGHRIGGSFLNYFLMAPLQRTVTFAQMNNIPGSVTQNLNFNMPGVADVSFHVKRVVTEGRARFCRGGTKDSCHLARIPD